MHHNRAIINAFQANVRSTPTNYDISLNVHALYSLWSAIHAHFNMIIILPIVAVMLILNTQVITIINITPTQLVNFEHNMGRRGGPMTLPGFKGTQ